MVKKIETGAKTPTEHDKLTKITNLHKAVFLSEEGAQLLEFLMADNHFVTGVYDESPHAMAFKEGQRSVIATILERVDIPMNQVRKMTEAVKDAYSDQETEEQRPTSFINQ